MNIIDKIISTISNFIDTALQTLGELITPELIMGIFSIVITVVVFLVFFDDDFDAMY